MINQSPVGVRFVEKELISPNLSGGVRFVDKKLISPNLSSDKLELGLWKIRAVFPKFISWGKVRGKRADFPKLIS